MQRLTLPTRRIRASPLKNVLQRITSSRCLSSDGIPTDPAPVEGESTDQKSKLGGFAQAFEKYTAPVVEPPKVQKSFATLLRQSKFIDVRSHITDHNNLNLFSINLLLFFFFFFAAGWSSRKSSYWKNISHRRRWLIYWLWLEVSLRMSTPC